jgi:hypothetical protein
MILAMEVSQKRYMFFYDLWGYDEEDFTVNGSDAKPMEIIHISGLSLC